MRNRCNEPGGWMENQVIFVLNHNDLNYRCQLSLMILSVRNNKPNVKWDFKVERVLVKGSRRICALNFDEI